MDKTIQAQQQKWVLLMHNVFSLSSELQRIVSVLARVA